MFYIYKFTNKITNKYYIGQTNNIEKRKRGHKSEAFNERANGYKLPFHCAIRKYGWDNFDFEVIEEIDETLGREYLNIRERYFIELFQSTVNKNGYNITLGGEGCNRPKLTFEEMVNLSKLFKIDEVKDIQQMLIDGYEYFEIQQKYPKLTASFLSNINNGLNFKRDDLTYPLATLHTKFTKATKEKIIQDIKSGIFYNEIAKKYGISAGYISAINSGKLWHSENEKYPLCLKGCADGAWSKDAKYDLIFTDISHSNLARKYNKSKATITAINVGRNRKDARLLYPLRDNQIENQKIWNTLF